MTDTGLNYPMYQKVPPGVLLTIYNDPNKERLPIQFQLQMKVLDKLFPAWTMSTEKFCTFRNELNIVSKMWHLTPMEIYSITKSPVKLKKFLDNSQNLEDNSVDRLTLSSGQMTNGQMTTELVEQYNLANNSSTNTTSNSVSFKSKRNKNENKRKRKTASLTEQIGVMKKSKHSKKPTVQEADPVSVDTNNVNYVADCNQYAQSSAKINVAPNENINYSISYDNSIEYDPSSDMSLYFNNSHSGTDSGNNSLLSTSFESDLFGSDYSQSTNSAFELPPINIFNNYQTDNDDMFNAFIHSLDSDFNL